MEEMRQAEKLKAESLKRLSGPSVEGYDPEDWEEKRTFHPEISLRRLSSLGPGSRKENLQKFKEEMIIQKIGIGEVKKMIFGMMNAYPDSSNEDLGHILEEAGGKLGLDSNQVQDIRRGIKAMVEKRDLIKKRVERFRDETTGKIDGVRAYRGIFQRDPSGRVSVEITPFSIFFRVEDVDDFCFLNNYLFLETSDEKREVTEADREKVRFIGGCQLTKTPTPGLERSINVEKCTDEFNPFDNPDSKPFHREIVRHEEQHAKNSLMLNAVGGFSGEIAKTAVDNLEIENLMKDEIIAYFAGGTPPAEVRKKFFDISGVNVFNCGRGYLNKGGSKTEKGFDKKLIRMVDEAILAFEGLVQEGFSAEEVSYMLINEFMESWPKMLERISGKGGAERRRAREAAIASAMNFDELWLAVRSIPFFVNSFDETTTISPDELISEYEKSIRSVLDDPNRRKGFERTGGHMLGYCKQYGVEKRVVELMKEMLAKLS